MQRNTETGKRFIDARTAAKLLGKTAGTLANERHFSRGLPYIKARGRILYDTKDITTYLENSKIYPQNR